ncbi:hypothetical protein [Fervidobacterium sp.]
MWGKTDKNFFTKFPFKSLPVLIVAFALLIIDFSFVGDYITILSDYLWLIDVTKTIISVILIASGVYEIIIFLFNFVPMSRYDKHFEELKTQIITEIKSKNQNILAEFISFRPWMVDESFVKAKKGLPKYFYPIYYVVLSMSNNILNIREYRLNIYEKTYHIAGYNVVPINTIISAGIVQDRVLFTSLSGEGASTVYFLELRTIGGNIKIPVLEEEISGRHGNVKELRDEMLLKVATTIKSIKSDWMKQET